MTDLRLILYQGSGPNAGGVIACLVVENMVYFSGLTPSCMSTTTINAAEAVVIAICTELGIDWRIHSFYDVQTHRAYASKRPGDYHVDLLTVKARRNGGIYVGDWRPIEYSDKPELFSGVPNGILEYFGCLINS